MPDPGLTAEVPLLEAGIRLGTAVLLGGLVGLDRELHQRPAGLRTHMLVSLAAASFTILTLNMFFSTAAESDLDPIRITEAVTTGVAFLGAGTIIRGGGSITGITTGASIWLAGAIGLAVGSGFYGLGAVVTAAGLFVLTVVGWAERRLFGLENDG